MTKTVTSPWDPAEHLKTGEDIAEYLEAALEEGDPTLIAAALGDIARAKGNGTYLTARPLRWAEKRSAFRRGRNDPREGTTLSAALTTPDDGGRRLQLFRPTPQSNRSDCR